MCGSGLILPWSQYFDDVSDSTPATPEKSYPVAPLCISRTNRRRPAGAESFVQRPQLIITFVVFCSASF